MQDLYKKFCLDYEMVLIPEVILLLFQRHLWFQSGLQLSLASQGRFYLVLFDSPGEHFYKMLISISN